MRSEGYTCSLRPPQVRNPGSAPARGGEHVLIQHVDFEWCRHTARSVARRRFEFDCYYYYASFRVMPHQYTKLLFIYHIIDCCVQLRRRALSRGGVVLRRATPCAVLVPLKASVFQYVMADASATLYSAEWLCVTAWTVRTL